MKGRAVLFGVSAALLGMALVAASVARWIDGKIPGEPLRDTWGAYRWQEDWAKAAKLPDGLSHDWLKPQGFRHIAHALGGAGTSKANTLEALDVAQSAGVDLFEVDIWLDGSGNLRCFHGAEDASEPPAMTQADCTLDTVLSAVAKQPGWLILDLKTDFVLTSQAIIPVLRKTGMASRIIYQLYRPEHVAMFNEWAKTLPLPAPIVTAYASHRGVQHIANQLPRIGAVAMAMPFGQREKLTQRPHQLALLLHPVHDCSLLAASKAWGATGAFVTSGLDCDRRP